jgi:hypothetical protein
VSLRYLSTHIFHFINTCCENLFLFDGSGARFVECSLTDRKDYFVRTGWVRLMSVFNWVLKKQLYPTFEDGNN